jgi:hypothetical protein
VTHERIRSCPLGMRTAPTCPLHKRLDDGFSSKSNFAHHHSDDRKAEWQKADSKGSYALSLASTRRITPYPSTLNKFLTPSVTKMRHGFKRSRAAHFSIP